MFKEDWKQAGEELFKALQACGPEFHSKTELAEKLGLPAGQWPRRYSMGLRAMEVFRAEWLDIRQVANASGTLEIQYRARSAPQSYVPLDSDDLGDALDDAMGFAYVGARICRSLKALGDGWFSVTEIWNEAGLESKWFGRFRDDLAYMVTCGEVERTEFHREFGLPETKYRLGKGCSD